MARKPNYKFDRMERDRAKAAKKAERARIKAERAEGRTTDADGNELPVDADGVVTDNEESTEPDQ